MKQWFSRTQLPVLISTKSQDFSILHQNHGMLSTGPHINCPTGYNLYGIGVGRTGRLPESPILITSSPPYGSIIFEVYQMPGTNRSFCYPILNNFNRRKVNSISCIFNHLLMISSHSPKRTIRLYINSSIPIGRNILHSGCFYLYR